MRVKSSTFIGMLVLKNSLHNAASSIRTFIKELARSTNNPNFFGRVLARFTYLEVCLSSTIVPCPYPAPTLQRTGRYAAHAELPSCLGHSAVSLTICHPHGTLSLGTSLPLALDSFHNTRLKEGWFREGLLEQLRHQVDVQCISTTELCLGELGFDEAGW